MEIIDQMLQVKLNGCCRFLGYPCPWRVLERSGCFFLICLTVPLKVIQCLNMKMEHHRVVRLVSVLGRISKVLSYGVPTVARCEYWLLTDHTNAAHMECACVQQRVGDT